MGKCRTCLKNRKRMHSLYARMEESPTITYADMVASFSNVKVSKNDGLLIEICVACCKRLKDIYEFRCQVERSDIELQKTSQLKRIIFTDIQDIKSKIEINEKDSKDAIVLKHEKITEAFVKSSEEALNYNSTIIKRLKCADNNVKTKMSVKEFLESIKEDPDNEYDIIYDVAVDYDPESDVGDDVDFDVGMEFDPESDEDYTHNKKNRKKLSKDVSGNTIIIKPVYLSDIRVARATVPFKKRKPHKTYKRQSKKKDMCPHCGKMFQSLKAHVLLHIGEKKFSCEKCSKRFYSESALRYHQKYHANRDYKCDKCVATFNTPYSLRTHQVIHASNVVKFPCETCGKTFRTKGHLWRHCQGVHNMGVKKYTCEQCSMSFVTRPGLNHHMRVHTGERPYKCEICSQPYSYKHDFNRHCLKKHGVFLKGRQVPVLNEEVLVKERALMSDLMLRVNGVKNTDNNKPINPFEGPHAVKAFEQAVKALASRQIQIDVQ